MYPMHVTNPQWARPEDFKMNINLDEINYEMEYDSIADIKMKDDTPIQMKKFSSIIRPCVNRATKPTSLKYEMPNQRDMILNEREGLVIKLFNYLNDQLAKQKELSELLKNKMNNDNFDGDGRKELMQRQQEISYEILQLKDVCKSTAIQIEEVDKDIEASPELNHLWTELSFIAQSKDKDIQELKRQCQQYQETNQATMEIEKMRQARRTQMEQEREQQLLKAERERKKMEAAKKADEEAAMVARARALEEDKFVNFLKRLAHGCRINLNLFFLEKGRGATETPSAIVRSNQ